MPDILGQFLDSGFCSELFRARLYYNGGATDNLAIDGTTPKMFTYGPADHIRIHRIDMDLISATTFNAAGCGSIASSAGISSPISLKIKSDAGDRLSLIDINPGAITSAEVGWNALWCSLADCAGITSFSTGSVLTLSWFFPAGITLNPDQEINPRIDAVVSANLSTAAAIRIAVYGYNLEQLR